MHPLLSKSLFIPTFAWNYFLGRILKRRNWWDRVDDHVVLGAMPLARDVPALVELGIRAVVNTCKEYSGPRAAYERYQIEQLWLPTVDFNPPTLGEVKRGVEFIQTHAGAGHSVYVHCKAGRARSATIVICWLVKYRGMSLEAAQAHLISHRPHVNPRLSQRAVVQQFCNELN